MTPQEKENLFKEACEFIERMVDKRLASDDRAQREGLHSRSRSLVIATLSLAVSLTVGAAGILFNGYLENRDRDDQVVREANQKKLKVIDEISSAITAIREGKDIAAASCKKTLSDDERLALKIDKIKRQYLLIQRARPMLHYFSDNFRQLIISFVDWDVAIDYCAKNMPDQEEWQSKQRQIEEEMIRAPVYLFIDSGYQSTR